MLYQVRHSIFPLHTSFVWRAKDVIAAWEEAGKVCWGVGGDFEDVPDVCGEEEGRPLEAEAEGLGGGVAGKGDEHISESLALYGDGW